MSEGIMGVDPAVDPAIAKPVAPAVVDALKEQQDSQANTEFLKSLPEALRETPSLKNVKGVEDLATQFVNQQSLLGNSLRIPSPDTGDEQKNEFYNKITSVPGVVRIPGDDADEAVVKEFNQKLGIPSSPDEYKINAPDGVVLEEDYIRGITQKAHELQLSNKQVNQIVAEDLANNKKANDDYLMYVSRSREALKSIWAQDYDTRVAGATNAMRIYAQEMPEFAAELDAVRDNPLFVKLLSDIGETLQEKGHLGMQTAGNYGLSVEEAKDKISEIMSNPNHPYFQGDEEAVQKMLKYHEVVSGGTV